MTVLRTCQRCGLRWAGAGSCPACPEQGQGLVPPQATVSGGISSTSRGYHGPALAIHGGRTIVGEIIEERSPRVSRQADPGRMLLGLAALVVPVELVRLAVLFLPVGRYLSDLAPFLFIGAVSLFVLALVSRRLAVFLLRVPLRLFLRPVRFIMSALPRHSRQVIRRLVVEMEPEGSLQGIELANPKRWPPSETRRVLFVVRPSRHPEIAIARALQPIDEEGYPAGPPVHGSSPNVVSGAAALAVCLVAAAGLEAALIGALP